MPETINKIIYFDKETIRNILQEYDHGERSDKKDILSSVQSNGTVDIEAKAKVQLNVPFVSRLQFLITGKISASYMIKRDNTTTITSTEISEFEKLKPKLLKKVNVQLSDIKNSSTSLRIAGSYLRFIKGDVEGLDTKEFKNVMDSFDGYDTYKMSDKNYVRFNNEAFVSNYKRNDLLNTTMTLYLIPVGTFNKSRFDFIDRVSKIEELITSDESCETLADVYLKGDNQNDMTDRAKSAERKNDDITLYDVLYASIEAEVTNGE